MTRMDTLLSWRRAYSVLLLVYSPYAKCYLQRVQEGTLHRRARIVNSEQIHVCAC